MEALLGKRGISPEWRLVKVYLSIPQRLTYQR